MTWWKKEPLPEPTYKVVTSHMNHATRRRLAAHRRGCKVCLGWKRGEPDCKLALALARPR